MKKAITILLGITMTAALLAGCGSTAETTQAPAAETAVEETAEAPAEEATEEVTEEAATEAGGVKTGLAVVSSIAKSTNPAEEDGLGEVDSNVVAVLVGEDGKIIDCKIDAIQTKINFTKEGKITSDLTAAIKTKQELGADYGLGKASGIQKEWNEQVNALADYVVGKTVDEVKGIAVSEEGAPTGEDLTASVTIKIGDYVAAIEKAVTNAKALGAGAEDKLGLAISTDSTKSTDATGDAEGLIQAYTFYSAVTTNAEGKITSCVIDASQGSVNFDATGTITSDLTVAPLTKQELKEDYGMKSKSAIGKEWYEQADAFALYAVGKTVDEVKGIAVSEEGVATEADLTSSVTVHVAPFIGIVEKAVANTAN